MAELALRRRISRPQNPAKRRRAPGAPGAVRDAASPKPRNSRITPTRGRGRRLWTWFESAAMVVALGAAAYALDDAYRATLDPDRVVPGVTVEGVAVGGLDPAALSQAVDTAAQRSLDTPRTLVAADATVPTTARALGAVPVPEAAIEAALAVGRSGDLLADLDARARARRGTTEIPVGYRFEQDPALAQLLALAPRVERPSLPTRLDMERRTVVPASAGAALLAYDSLSAIAVGLAAGDDRIALVVQDKPLVSDPLSSIAAGLDIDVVLGSFETPYRQGGAQADRGHNLKLGAAAVDGLVLMPGQEFSFNETVGPRSAAAGFRYAPGITGGETVDVLGGGICQISSTLYGAAFFGGLELVRARPHSRPSSYVDMGLDSTVVYPDIDLKLRNSFDFPIVLHMVVRQGKVRGEVLGPRRPYQVAFERELEEVVPYRTIWRDDPRLREGTETVSQRGMRGFKMTRRRKLYQGGTLIKTERWELNYPATSEIVRRGIDPQGPLPEQKPKVALRDPPETLRMMQ